MNISKLLRKNVCIEETGKKKHISLDAQFNVLIEFDENDVNY